MYGLALVKILSYVWPVKYISYYRNINAPVYVVLEGMDRPWRF